MARYNLSPQELSEISSAIKRANQRMNQIGKTYGFESSVYKQEVGKFQKGAFKDLTRTTTGKARGRNVAKATQGEWKSPGKHMAFNTKAIMDLVRREGASSKVNVVLGELAGVKIKGNFSEHEELGVPLRLDIRKLKGGGVPTVSELTKRTEKKLERMGEDPGDYTKKELQKITEQLYEFSENFQTSYNEYMAQYGEEGASKDPTIKLLYGENRNRRLTYPELEAIKARMDEMTAAAKNDALSFEKDNT